MDNNSNNNQAVNNSEPGKLGVENNTNVVPQAVESSPEVIRPLSPPTSGQINNPTDNSISQNSNGANLQSQSNSTQPTVGAIDSPQNSSIQSEVIMSNSAYEQTNGNSGLKPKPNKVVLVTLITLFSIIESLLVLVSLFIGMFYSFGACFKSECSGSSELAPLLFPLLVVAVTAPLFGGIIYFYVKRVPNSKVIKTPFKK